MPRDARECDCGCGWKAQAGVDARFFSCARRPSHILGFERRDVSVTPVPEIIRAEPLAPPRDREPEERRSEDQRREPRRLDVRVGGAAREDRERGSRRAPPRSALRTHDDGVKKRGRGFSQGGVGAMIAFGTRA